MESEKMRFSRLGILSVTLLTVLFGANCDYYNRIITQKNLVDGGSAYKNRKFKEAEELFRYAVSRDPEGKTTEGRAAQLLLARTLHSEYIGDRKETEKAEEAIQQYKKVLVVNVKDQESFNAVANLLENLNKDDEWLKWVTERTVNEQVSEIQRAEALTKLAAKKYSCANEISDVEPVKKTVTKGDKKVFEFVKPQDQASFETYKKCVQEGADLTERAVKLDANSDAVWSYKANMLVQQSRLAEMEGNAQQKDEFRAQADKAKEKFTELARLRKEKEDALKAEKAAKENVANSNTKK